MNKDKGRARPFSDVFSDKLDAIGRTVTHVIVTTSEYVEGIIGHSARVLIFDGRETDDPREEYVDETNKYTVYMLLEGRRIVVVEPHAARRAYVRAVNEVHGDAVG